MDDEVKLCSECVYHEEDWNPFNMRYEELCRLGGMMLGHEAAACSEFRQVHWCRDCEHWAAMRNEGSAISEWCTLKDMFMPDDSKACADYKKSEWVTG